MLAGTSAAFSRPPEPPTYEKMPETAIASAKEAAEKATMIIRDLRDLKIAALLYYADNGGWPKAGDEIKLDKYMDRPLAGADPKKYDKVMIGLPYKNANAEKQNIGVRLMAVKNGTDDIQKKLAGSAQAAGLLGTANKGDVYTGGFEVWMSMR